MDCTYPFTHGDHPAPPAVCGIPSPTRITLVSGVLWDSFTHEDHPRVRRSVGSLHPRGSPSCPAFCGIPSPTGITLRVRRSMGFLHPRGSPCVSGVLWDSFTHGESLRVSVFRPRQLTFLYHHFASCFIEYILTLH